MSISVIRKLTVTNVKTLNIGLVLLCRWSELYWYSQRDALFVRILGRVRVGREKLVFVVYSETRKASVL